METILVVGDNKIQGLAEAAELAMDGMDIIYHPEGYIPFDPLFDPPLSHLPEETYEKTVGDRDRLTKAVEKRERKRLKAIRDLGK